MPVLRRRPVYSGLSSRMPDDSSSNSTMSTLTDSGTLENHTDRDGHEGDDERTDGGETLERGSPERENSNNESNASDEKQPSFEDPQIKPMPIRKKHRRGSKRNRRKYKPYSKLSWEEKKAVEERDTKRAYQMRERYMNEKGRPTAPYNTTQFLMAEHDVHEPDLGSHTHVHSHSESVDSVQQRHASVSADDSRSEPDDCYDSPEDDLYEQQFFEKDFSETYEQLHEENLHSMSKNDLVREFIQLENRVDILEKKIVVGESDMNCNGLERQTSLEELCLKINGERTELTNENSDEFASDEDLRAELNRLRQENARLQNENLELRNQIRSDV